MLRRRDLRPTTVFRPTQHSRYRSTQSHQFETGTPRNAPPPQLLQVALVAQISICSCRTTPRKQMQTPTRSTSTTMDSSEQNSNVVIWFREPVEIQPESERRPVLSNRHTVTAARLIQDSTRTTLIDANGEVVHVFDTGNVLDIDWGVRNESATTRSTAKPPTKPTASTPPADERSGRANPRNEGVARHHQRSIPRRYAPWSDHEDEELTAEYEAV